MRRNLAREQYKSDWSMDELREALLREIRILDQGVFTSITSLSDTSPMMTASLHAGARSGHSKQQRSDRGTFNKKLTCAYCKALTQLTTVMWLLTQRNVMNMLREKVYVLIVLVNTESVNVHHNPVIRNETTNTTPAFVVPSHYYHL